MTNKIYMYWVLAIWKISIMGNIQNIVLYSTLFHLIFEIYQIDKKKNNLAWPITWPVNIWENSFFLTEVINLQTELDHAP